MSPNSQLKVESEVNLLTDSTITMNRDREDSLVSATTDAALPVKPPEKKPIDGFDDFMGFINDVKQEIKDDGSPENDGPSPPSDGNGNDANNAKNTDPSDAKGAEATDANKEGGSSDKEGGRNDAEPRQRRRSSELRDHLDKNSLLHSVKTVDSWGGDNLGSLPPMSKRNTMPEFNTTSSELVEAGDVSDLDDSNTSREKDGTSPPQDTGKDPANRSQSWCPPSNQGTTDSSDNVAQYVNFNKLLQPGSSKYYYSQANRSNRQLLDKVNPKSSKKLVRMGSLDESGHSRVSMLSERERVSSYRGPAVKMRDGSGVKSLMKKDRGSLNSDNALSIDSIRSEQDLVAVAAPKKAGLKRCSFSSVDIREHERVAGDNPCVTSGVPLSIGWGYYQHKPIDLDDYETNKGPSRDKIEMMVPASVRRSMLREEFGVSISEMNAAMKQVNITKRQRRHTVATEHMEGWSEVLQSAKRKFRRFAKGTSNVKEEEKMWAQAHNTARGEYLKKHGGGSLGKNHENAGVGGINQGPKIVPNNSNGEASAPCMEISFQQGDAEGGAPTF